MTPNTPPSMAPYAGTSVDRIVPDDLVEKVARALSKQTYAAFKGVDHELGLWRAFMPEARCAILTIQEYGWGSKDIPSPSTSSVSRD